VNGRSRVHAPSILAAVVAGILAAVVAGAAVWGYVALLTGGMS
jgi:hypothetical protein